MKRVILRVIGPPDDEQFDYGYVDFIFEDDGYDELGLVGAYADGDIPESELEGAKRLPDVQVGPDEWRRWIEGK